MNECRRGKSSCTRALEHQPLTVQEVRKRGRAVAENVFPDFVRHLVRCDAEWSRFGAIHCHLTEVERGGREQDNRDATYHAASATRCSSSCRLSSHSMIQQGNRDPKGSWSPIRMCGRTPIG